MTRPYHDGEIDKKTGRYLDDPTDDARFWPFLVRWGVLASCATLAGVVAAAWWFA